MTDSRVALIGYGTGGAAFHAPIINSTPGLDLAAVVTVNPDRQAEVRARYPQTQVVPSVDDLLSRAADYDLAVVTTPNRQHAPLAAEALRRGVGVVVDKPFASTSRQATDLVELAERSGLLLSVFQNRRYDGDFLTVQRLLASGELGTVHRFESRFERWRPELKDGWKESADPADAGGILFDLGSHVIDQALVLFGPPTRVYAEVAIRRQAARVDDDVFLDLTHAGGVRSQLWMSALAADLGPRFRVLGDRAAYVKYGLDPQESALRAGADPTEPGWGEESREAWGQLGVPGKTAPYPTEAGAYQRYYQGIAEALSSKAAPPVNPRDAVRTLLVIEAAYRSAAELQVVTLD